MRTIIIVNRWTDIQGGPKNCTFPQYTVDSTCIVLLGIHSGVSMPKIIKFGWDFTKLYQFNIKQMEMCSFFGPPCRYGRKYLCCMLSRRWRLCTVSDRRSESFSERNVQSYNGTHGTNHSLYITQPAMVSGNAPLLIYPNLIHYSPKVEKGTESNCLIRLHYHKRT